MPLTASEFLKIYFDVLESGDEIGAFNFTHKDTEIWA